MPRGLFKTKGYFKQMLSNNKSYLAASHPLSSISHFLKMPQNLNRLELEANIFRIFNISLIPITGKNFKKNT